jgi:hypothetical protein
VGVVEELFLAGLLDAGFAPVLAAFGPAPAAVVNRASS